VTGGTRGIGLRVARSLAQEGASVAICSRNSTEVANVVKELEQSGVASWGRQADLAKPDQIVSWVNEAAAALGGIDLLVANASAMTSADTIANWQAMFEIDLLSSVRLFAAARPYLEASGKRDDASFTIVSSISALETTRVSAYGAMKAALNHFAKGLAHELAPIGVRVNVVAPGQIYFDGGLWARIQKERPEYYATMLAANPTGRFGQPEEVADLVTFLASPRSRFTTGATVAIDGTVTRRTS
jgi:3-oxoacyl-[acyl-carrier protein] reductase